MDNTPQSIATGCLMCDSLYVKANGEVPCWDDAGEDLILRTIGEQDLLAQREQRLFDFPALVAIRRAFLEGRDPHLDLCSKCAVRGHGAATSLHPEAIRVLHIEPAYLCQLACPQCIAPKLRLQLKGPPYYMSLSFYEALLRQLREEGIHAIRLVHFEGRGDPLLNQDLGEIIRCTRAIYPDAYIKVTTHGNYPFKSWMLDSDLDLLRLSVDGAFEDSYAKYRVGGKLQVALDLMKAIRDNRRKITSRLRVEWKYILFEWNDSDDEIREAARLADELEVDLRFCLTHTLGKSKRFQSMAALSDILDNLAPLAAQAITFQLKVGPSDASIRHVVAEHAEALLLSSLKSYRSGRSQAGRSYLIKALTYDPGLDASEVEACGEHPAKEHLDRIISNVAFPSTFSALANIHLTLEEWEVAEQMFRGYLSLAPDASDRVKVEQLLIDLSVNNCLGCALAQAGSIEPTRVFCAELALLKIDPGFAETELQTKQGDPVCKLLPRVLATCRYPSTVFTLARLRSMQEDFDSAVILFNHYLKSAPGNERPIVLKHLNAVRRARIPRTVKRLLDYLYVWASNRASFIPDRVAGVTQALLRKPPNQSLQRTRKHASRLSGR